MWQWPRAQQSHVTVFTGTRTPMYSSVHAHTCANKHSKLSMLVSHTQPLLRAEWNSWEDILSIWPTSTSDVKYGRPGFSSPQWEGILESQQRVLPGLPWPPGQVFRGQERSLQLSQTLPKRSRGMSLKNPARQWGRGNYLSLLIEFWTWQWSSVLGERDMGWVEFLT